MIPDIERRSFPEGKFWVLYDRQNCGPVLTEDRFDSEHRAREFLEMFKAALVEVPAEEEQTVAEEKPKKKKRKKKGE